MALRRRTDDLRFHATDKLFPGRRLANDHRHGRPKEIEIPHIEKAEPVGIERPSQTDEVRSIGIPAGANALVLGPAVAALVAQAGFCILRDHRFGQDPENAGGSDELRLPLSMVRIPAIVHSPAVVQDGEGEDEGQVDIGEPVREPETGSATSLQWILPCSSSPAQSAGVSSSSRSARQLLLARPPPSRGGP
ncbi:hypothetical protein A9O63_12535 [Cereibacter johrii]|nr:hypothetical protein A9O63_12535 [Cereibacter johrii]